MVLDCSFGFEFGISCVEPRANGVDAMFGIERVDLVKQVKKELLMLQF